MESFESIYTISIFRGLSNNHVTAEVPKGLRMEPPTNCPKGIADIMKNCWKSDQNARDSFKKIYQKKEKWSQLESSAKTIFGFNYVRASENSQPYQATSKSSRDEPQKNAYGILKTLESGSNDPEPVYRPSIISEEQPQAYANVNVSTTSLNENLSSWEQPQVYANTNASTAFSDKESHSEKEETMKELKDKNDLLSRENESLKNQVEELKKRLSEHTQWKEQFSWRLQELSEEKKSQ